MNFFISIVGMGVLLGIAVLLSDNRRSINLRTVISAFSIQFGIGAFILYIPVGRDILYSITTADQTLSLTAMMESTSCSEV